MKQYGLIAARNTIILACTPAQAELACALEMIDRWPLFEWPIKPWAIGTGEQVGAARWSKTRATALPIKPWQPTMTELAKRNGRHTTVAGRRRID